MDDKTASDRVKTLLSILCIFICGLVAGWAFFSATAETQVLREVEFSALESKIADAKIGSFVKLQGHGFLKTSRPQEGER